MSKYNKDIIEKALKSKNYDWFKDINIVGIRNSDTGKKVSNLFDDLISVSYIENGSWQYIEWPCTTDPGIKGVVEFNNPNGVARVVPGQYKSSHTIGLHKGKYQALTQQNPIKVYRDKDKNLIFDESKITEGIYGINIHKAGRSSTYVENWSEGCQVFKKSMDFDEFMKICKRFVSKNSKSFTYTLIESKDIA